MPAIQQPAIQNDFGIILTVGFLAIDRMACVLPMVTDNTTLTDANRAQDAITAFEAHVRTAWLGTMSPGCEMSYIQAEGMVDGIVPARADWAAGTYPGTLAGDVLPNNVTGLMNFYEDPLDIAPNKRMRVAKTFMPGAPRTEVVGDIISDTLFGLYTALGIILQNGYAVGSGSGKWYRMLSAPYQITANPTPPPAMIRTRPRGIQVPRIIGIAPRAYVGTQRRRLIPHV